MPAGKPPEATPKVQLIADQPLTELEKIVAEMRSLGISEYRNGDLHVKLGEPTSKPTDKSEAEEQHYRDLREQKELARQARILRASSSYFGPPLPRIK